MARYTVVGFWPPNGQATRAAPRRKHAAERPFLQDYSEAQRIADDMEKEGCRRAEIRRYDVSDEWVSVYRLQRDVEKEVSAIGHFRRGAGGAP